MVLVYVVYGSQGFPHCFTSKANNRRIELIFGNFNGVSGLFGMVPYQDIISEIPYLLCIILSLRWLEIRWPTYHIVQIYPPVIKHGNGKYLIYRWFHFQFKRCFPMSVRKETIVDLQSSGRAFLAKWTYEICVLAGKGRMGFGTCCFLSLKW